MLVARAISTGLCIGFYVDWVCGCVCVVCVVTLRLRISMASLSLHMEIYVLLSKIRI